MRDSDRSIRWEEVIYCVQIKLAQLMGDLIKFVQMIGDLVILCMYELDEVPRSRYVD